MNKLFGSLLFFGLFGFMSTSLWGQNLPDEQVTVLKNFDAQLADAERVNITPELPEVDTTRLEQSYFLPYKPLNVNYPAPKIRPFSVRSERPPQSYNGLVRLGGGTPNSLFGTGSYNYLFEDHFDIGINLHHHSANFKQVDNQRFNYNAVSGSGTYYFDQGFAASANLGYTSDEVYFYGYNFDDDLKDLEIESEDVRQRFTTFEAGGSIFNGERNVGDINYKADVDFYLLRDNYATQETGVDLNIGGTKWFNGKHAATLLINTDFTTFEDTATQRLNNFFAKPSFTYHMDVLKVKLGMNIASNDDNFFFFPDVLATVNIIGGQLAAFAGAEGTLQKNNLRSLSDYNPFIDTRLNLQNTRLQHYYGGVKGNLDFAQYSAQVGYKQADDLALFLEEEIPDNIVRKRFEVLYDTARIYNIQGNIQVKLMEDLTILGTVNQNFYDMANEEKPWHLPALSINGTVQYSTLEDKLQLRAELWIENGVPYINDLGEVDNLNGLFDISLGADYFFTEHIGAFFQINNLADNRRQRWADYPIYGINILGGVSARF
jgi:hypothetical protein